MAAWPTALAAGGISAKSDERSAASIGQVGTQAWPERVGKSRVRRDGAPLHDLADHTDEGIILGQVCARLPIAVYTAWSKEERVCIGGGWCNRD